MLEQRRFNVDSTLFQRRVPAGYGAYSVRTGNESICHSLG